MTAIHLVDMDSHRHKYGVRSKQAYEALKRLDGNLGDIIQATKDAGFEQTNFVVLGDHFQIDVAKIHLNKLFAINDWLTVTDKGLIAMIGEC
ncbi:alkaline phosphatase family protein [Leuconostoc mesenteroides]|uniref:alkaline phosphatase family protein n=1 Tax=Leuconostoc mesenteroides TaxID=1245 RepID=UPI001FA91D05|nr:alkaline phosphatase family protein [Leuconostoc mesenteroides]